MLPTSTNIAIGTSCLITGYLCYARVKSDDMRRMLSSLLEKRSINPVIEPDVVRNAFTDTMLSRPKLVKGHTHPTAAAIRTCGSLFAYNMALATGMRLYSYEMSKSDQRKGIAGCRQWRWAKDTNASNRKDVETSDDLRYICDVDYYMDMPHFLIDRVQPTLLYTFVPRAAASDDEQDTSYYFEEDGSVTSLIAGSGRYEHHLWNYSCDSIKAIRRSWFNIPTHLATYAVERRQVGPSRQVVLLTPIKEWTGCWAILANWIIAGTELKRFDPIVRALDGTPFVRFLVRDSDGAKYTTGKPGQFLCATVPVRADEAVGTVAELGSANLQLPTTAKWLGKDMMFEATILTEYYRKVGPRKTPTVYPVSEAVRGYTYEPDQYDAERRPKLQPFMAPLFHGAFAPIPDAAAERRCVEGRINSLRKREPEPNSFVSKCMCEFAEFVVGSTVLSPVCLDVVASKQTRPAQKLSLERAYVAGPHSQNVLKCFIKAEAYPDIKDPRNISQYNDRDKLTMAQYALALSEHLKQFPWYAPGMNPREIATRVSEVCQGADFVNISDYHRMDGTITYTLRKVERVVCMKIFANHRTELNDLLRNNCDNMGFLPEGTQFDQGPSHGSGCSATSVFQTLRAAFTTYLGYRHQKTATGEWAHSPQTAFESIGIHLGDDGLDPDLPVADHEWAANKVGLVLEAATAIRGDRGVNFLARYYSADVWTGGLDSMCDVKRQIAKFHTTVRLPAGYSPIYKLVEKARGYVATDGNTPVIGELCRKVLSTMGSTYTTQNNGPEIKHWWSKFESSVQFPNENTNGWMDSEFDILFPDFDRSIFKDWLDGATKCETQRCEIREPGEEHTPTRSCFLCPPLCVEIKPPTIKCVDVIVDNDVHFAQTPDNPEEKAKGTIVESAPAKAATTAKPPAEKSKTRPPRAPTSVDRQRARAARGKPQSKKKKSQVKKPGNAPGKRNAVSTPHKEV